MANIVSISSCLRPHEAVIAVAKAIMERAAEPAVSLSVPLVVDARAAANWDDAH